MARKTGPRKAVEQTAESAANPSKPAPAAQRGAGSRAPRASKAPSDSSGAADTGSETRTAGLGRFPIVVVGASAGGLSALRTLLAAMPADGGLALVLVPHLDPTHESLMAELLSRATPMPVHEAADGTTIVPDEIYVIPPNRNLAIEHGTLKLSKPPEPRGLQTAIDFSLCSLADDQKDAAIGIVLSGTGSHGTSGVKAIKLAGGTVIVQDPATAEYDQMPRNALATGLVDYVLAPEDMPEVLVRHARHVSRKPGTEAPDAASLDGLRQVLALLQTRVKYDFRHYRKNMVMRRIQRRMVLLQIEEVNDYVVYLREHPEEVTALYKDLLISVTSFFRDPDAFGALAERVLPKLVERASAEAPVRIWVPGCATGEEAYTIAILAIEQFRAAGKAPHIQIFATDIDEDALEGARRGVYADSVTAPVSSERLQRYFVKVDEHHWQVSKELRESIAFAAQNLISDAPFSKLDLISCRNLLIYLEPEVQTKVISLLHFALDEDGYLLLGPSESIGRAVDMFEAVSKKWRLYRRIGPVRRDLVNIPIISTDRRSSAAYAEPVRRPSVGFTELMQKLLAQDFAPASALVNRKYEILAVQGPLVSYLEFPPGEMTRDLLAMARHGLRNKIRSVCQQAVREGHTVADVEARVRRNGHYVRCTVTVRPIVEPKEAEGLLLVVFQDRPGAPSASLREGAAGHEPSPSYELEDELRATREDLKRTIDELETSNEELKASNEEVMSMNEELQSANEELETSKEELQSLNEELATVNNELRDKVDDLNQVNNDLTNLMTATDIPTVFLDTELRLKRFTPAAAALLSLMASDVGRPFRDFAPKLEDEDLLRDAERVIETLMASVKEVRAGETQWYLRRILPYRADNRIGGVVITFVDVTPRMEAEAQAQRLAAVLLDSSDAVVVCRMDGRIIAWNHAAQHMYGYPESEALEMNLRDLVPDELAQDALEQLEQAARRGAGEAFETKRRARDGRGLDVWLTATLLKDEAGRPVAMATAERDVTVRKQVTEEARKLNASLEKRIAERTSELEASERRLRSILDATADAIVTIDAEGNIETFNAAAERIFGYTAAEVIGRNVKLLMPPPYRDRHDACLRRFQQTGEARMIGRSRELTARRKGGTDFPIQLSVNEVNRLGLFTGVIRDISEQKVLQEEVLRISALEQRRIGQELHDGTQQELSGLGLLARSLSDTLTAEGNSSASELAARLAAGIGEVNSHVRSIAKGLVPVPIDAEGLMAALDDLARSTQERYGLSCRFECPAPVVIADDVAAMHLYRIAQEGVLNAVKHAHASAVTIRLGRDAKGVELVVADDGAGFDPESKERQGAGLRIMKHRCELIGGRLEIRPGAGGGTVVACSVPETSGI
jgi:two-component system, chemotaxis family, CheB/CheR fusion protein